MSDLTKQLRDQHLTSFNAVMTIREAAADRIEMLDANFSTKYVLRNWLAAGAVGFGIGYFIKGIF